MNDFQKMDLPKEVLLNLQNMQFDKATPIQEKAIPLALKGNDILGSAQTGTGKTGAFGIPLAAHLMNNKESLAIVITPTRELAMQVLEQVQKMIGKSSKIHSALLIGGDSISKQFAQLRRKPRLIVGTPGRINDHLDRGSLDLKMADFLILDEMDRMLDMGFKIQIDKVIAATKKVRQTLLFSATMPDNIVKSASKYLKDPIRISIDDKIVAGKNITQDSINVKTSEKHSKLVSELNDREGSIVIFMKMKYATEKMATKLSEEGHSCGAIHGDLRQSKRERVINAFRKKKYRILVCTDVVARGLDIPHIKHVINYDLPSCPEDYIHRIGRTARNGSEGFALSLISPEDRRKWQAIDELMNPGTKKTQKNDGFGKSRRPRNDSKPGGKPFGGKSKKITRKPRPTRAA